ncbi:MAG: DegV family protein [Clostridia bacterium]|nr:DegV family protein [Clostridia bacterium]
MNDFVILTDSCCDLPAELAGKEGISVIPLTVTLEGKEYRNMLDGSDIASEDFYARLRNGALATTSAASVGMFQDAMEPILKEGKDILCIAFSSGLSSTCSSAQIAAGELSERYPEQKVYVVDSLCASLGQGLLVYHACRKKESGASIEEVRDWLEENKLSLCHWFTVDSLSHLRRGGRLSSAKALLGSLLHVKPVLHMDNDGHLINMETVRGRNTALKRLTEKMAELATDPQTQTVFISHADDIEAAELVASDVRERFGIKDILISSIGPVIGAHCGPGTVALFFLGKER